MVLEGVPLDGHMMLDGIITFGILAPADGHLVRTVIVYGEENGEAPMYGALLPITSIAPSSPELPSVTVGKISLGGAFLTLTH